MVLLNSKELLLEACPNIYIYLRISISPPYLAGVQHPCQQTIPQVFSPTKALRTFVDFLSVMVGVQKSKDGSIATLGEARESLGGRDFQPSIMLGPIFVYMHIYI